ncbi:MAG: thiamine pyrophosphate-dependent enzyme [Bacteroidales bacterium]
MQKLLLLGDEAIAQGAIDSGLSGIYAYPGTPSTEITEYVIRNKEAREKKIRASWSANEKTAMEAALGMSYAGKRAMVCMKHVGLNVAADAFLNSAITGANGGLIVVSADDPSMHSSQNEQDSRFYGQFAMIPVLEPSNQQEAYDMVRYGFEISEKYGTPVMMRITTRLAHSRSGIIRKEGVGQNSLKLPEDLTQYILLPSLARKRYQLLLENQGVFKKESGNSGYNRFFDGEDKKRGIITTGIAYNYLMENFPEGSLKNPVLKITQYPLPEKMVRKVYEACDEILVIEEGYPLVEDMLKGFLNTGKPVHGRMDGTLPRTGELTPDIVEKAVKEGPDDEQKVSDLVQVRPPKLCKGCSHMDSFRALNAALEEYSKGRVFSDIGCYTLSAMKPLESINSCVDMGASVTMAVGAADAGLVPAVAAIGDSTFTHSGMTGLLDAVISDSPITVLILDNSTTAMTGGQPSAALGKLEDICKGIGVKEEHIHVINPIPKEHDKNVKIIREELEHPGISVVIPRRECIQTLAKRMKAKRKVRQEKQS